MADYVSVDLVSQILKDKSSYFKMLSEIESKPQEEREIYNFAALQYEQSAYLIKKLKKRACYFIR